MKIFIHFIAILAFVFSININTIFADEITETGNILTPPIIIQKITPICSNIYTISGPSDIKVNTSHEYALTTGEDKVLPFGKFNLSGKTKPVTQNLEREYFAYTFSEPGTFTLSAELDPQVHQCQGKLEKKITVHKELITYIGRERSDIFGGNWKKILQERAVLLEAFNSENNHLEESPTLANSIANADILIINTTDILGTFSQLERIQKIKQQSLSKTNVFIISTQQKPFLSKILASSVAKMGINRVFLINNDQLSSLLGQWSSEENRNATAGEELSYSKKEFTFSLSSALDYLVYKGIPYQFVGFLLALSIVALLCNVLKQIIGLDVFMLYYPIVLGIIFSQIGFLSTLLLIIIAVSSLSLVRLVTSKIQLLINAKKSFLISVYILLLFLTFGILNLADMNPFDYKIFISPIAAIAIFSVLFIVEKIMDNTKIFSLSGVSHLMQYAFIVFIVWGILSWNSLQYFMISYPDIIFLVVIANLLVGRYTGLQITEYFRFSPILASITNPFKNIHEEE